MSASNWRRVAVLSLIGLCIAGCRGEKSAERADSQITKTRIHRLTPRTEEFRGIFVATAYNLDWPFKANLHHTEMRRQMEVVIQSAKDLKANVILLQVRSFGDRIYRETSVSPAIPWAAALNGGKEPDEVNAAYDPLREWIVACHNEGIQIHAWFNPFRVDTLVQVHDDPADENNDRFLEVIHTPDGHHVHLDARKPSVQSYVLSVLDDLLEHYGPEQLPPQVRQMRQPNGRIIAASMLGTDGLDGIIIDHDLPPPDEGPATTLPAGTQPGARRDEPHATPRVIYLGYGPSRKPMQTPTPRTAWLKKKASTRPAVKNEGELDWEPLIGEMYRRVDQKGMAFGISPEWDDGNAAEWVRKGWCDYVIPEVYLERNAVAGQENDFEQAMKPWWGLEGPDGSKPVVVAGIYGARTHVPAKGSDRRWDVDEILLQVKDARNLVPPQRKGGQALYSWSSLRSPHQAGPETNRNLGEKLKVRRGRNDDYADSAAVPRLKSSSAN